MSDYDNDYNNQPGAKPDDVRHALKGWALFLVGTIALFGGAYAWLEM